MFLSFCNTQFISIVLFVLFVSVYLYFTLTSGGASETLNASSVDDAAVVDSDPESPTDSEASPSADEVAPADGEVAHST